MQNFTNEEIDLSTLPKYEEVELTNPDPKYWKVILINLFIFLGILGAISLSLILFAEKFKPHTILITTTYFVLVFLFFLLYRLSFKSRGYALRSHDVIYKSGIIAQTTTIVPLSRIQHIELNEGIFSRIYQLGSLQIFTAGGQTGHLQISGIPIEQAKSIRDLLLKNMDLLDNPNTDGQ